MFERSCDSITAFAAALNTAYERRGFRMISRDGARIKDPFRKSLGNAVQWYDVLQRRTEDMVSQALQECDDRIQAEKCPANPVSSSPLPPNRSLKDLNPPFTLAEVVVNKPADYAAPAPGARMGPTPESLANETETAQSIPHPVNEIETVNDDTPETTEIKLTPGECHRILREACPCCFGGSLFGRSFNQDGGDIHVAIDGNFHHKHVHGAGANNEFYQNRRFLSKEYIDAVGERLAQAKKRPAKAYTSPISEATINGCRESHHAAKGDDAGDGAEGNGKGIEFDDKGIMALVCRHDIPILLANIDTPGEQQKYAVALIEAFCQMIPREVTSTFCYDVALSLMSYDFLPDWILDRVLFVTSAMHAYGHGWICQLEYNPRLKKGLGLTDGEGVKRFWSRLRQLIGVERWSSRPRRLWLVDRQADAIAKELKEGLGYWITHRLEVGMLEQEQDAQLKLDEAGIEVAICREQWKLQKKEQLVSESVRPGGVKKEMDKVLSLTTEIDRLDAIIAKTTKAIHQSGATPDSLEIITKLKETQTSLKVQSDGLYISLNVTSDFPELRYLPRELLQKLIVARSLKMIIRKKAISSFHEWDKLNQSISGRNKSIGTTLHQNTRKAISKRKPALLTQIKKFNGLRDEVQQLATDYPNIAIPTPLPTGLQDLRDSEDLMQDVLLSTSMGPLPLWARDPRVRQGISATLKLDRCREERRRLGREADNLCCSFGRELTAIELARRLPKYRHLAVLINERRQNMLHLKSAWSTALASPARFTSAAEASQRTANSIAGSYIPEFRWVTAHLTGYHSTETSTWRHRKKASPTVDIEPMASDLVVAEASRNDSSCDSGDDSSIPPVPPQTDIESERESSGDESEIDMASSEADDKTAEPVPINSARPDSLFPPPVITWNQPNLNYDHTLLQALELAAAASPYQPMQQAIRRALPGSDLYFGIKEITILRSPRAWLNSDCVNELCSLLHHICPEPNCAILSTFSLPTSESADASSLWRTVKKVRYWEKDLWLLPIHRIDDLGGGPNSWNPDISRILHLLHRLIELADTNGHPVVQSPGKPWTFRPLNTEALQQNHHDCGLWVVATIAAFLRGYQFTKLTEADMDSVRLQFLKLIHLIPPLV
ncbi:hypothetical protein C8J56DRAFT_1044865 [Mycena floridula]|nr:hypothetical protein C8J56DRAFT_1044865 [Mycena floridula]